MTLQLDYRTEKPRSGRRGSPHQEATARHGESWHRTLFDRLGWTRWKRWWSDVRAACASPSRWGDRTYRRLQFEPLEARAVMAGDLVWAGAISGGAAGEIRATAVDDQGNIVVTGNFRGNTDFDPGTGIVQLSAQSESDVFIAKYTAAGELMWAKQLASSKLAYGYGAAVDSQGGVVVTGKFSGSLDADPGADSTILTEAGNSDVFVVKLDAQGNYQWSKQYGGTNTDSGNAVAVDADDNVIVTGQFIHRWLGDLDPSEGVVEFVSQGMDSFAIKLDTDGNYVWAKQIGGVGDQYGTGVTVDSSGNVVLAGYFQASKGSDFDTGEGTTILTSLGGFDAYVAKLDSAGNFQWAKSFGGTEEDRGTGVAVDQAGNVALSGFFRKTVDFDPGAGTALLTSNGSYDAFVVRLDAEGNYAWARNFGSTSFDYAQSVAFDAAGDLLLAGEFRHSVDFDGDGVAELVSNADSVDAFVAKLDADGNHRWSKQIGGTSHDDSGYGVAADAAGNVVVVGRIQGSVDLDLGHGMVPFSTGVGVGSFVTKLTSSGEFDWSRAPFQSGTVETRDTAVDASGNVYVTGEFTGVADFDFGLGASRLSSIGFNDAYVAKYSAAGELVWVKQFGGTEYCAAMGLALDSAGNVVVTGWFRGTTDFDPGDGVYSFTSPFERSNTFIVKLDAAGDFVWAKQLESAYGSYSKGIATDADGNVLVTGSFGGIVDFDPGEGVVQLTGSAPDNTFVLKLDDAGQFAWARQFNGVGNMAADAQGIVVVVGTYGGVGYVTQLDAAGTEQWTKYVGGIANGAFSSAAIDSQGNILIAGSFRQTVDFDPSEKVATLTSAGNFDGFVLKLSDTGEYRWAKRFGGWSTDFASALAVDAGDNVIVTGNFREWGDFNDGGGYLESFGGYDVFVKKMDADGNHLWRTQFGGTGGDNGYAVAVDPLGDIYVAGTFFGNCDFEARPGEMLFLNAGYTNGGFLAKLSDNTAPLLTANTGLTLNEGATSPITSAQLQVLDAESSAAELIYTLQWTPVNGLLQKNGITLGAGDVFSQQDIDDGIITYSHDAGESTADGFSFTITDGGGRRIGGTTFAITITPVNDAPVFGDSALSLYAKAKTGTVVGTVRATDVDAAQKLSYSIVGGNNGAFAVDAATGVVTVVDAKKLVGNRMNIVLRVTDDGANPLQADATLAIDLMKTNTPPVFAMVNGNGVVGTAAGKKGTLTFDESTYTSATQNGMLVGTLQVTDADQPGATLTATMIDKSGAFAFDAATGRITVADASKLDFEKQKSITLTFKAIDAGLAGMKGAKTSTLTLKINLRDVNEAPIAGGPTNLTVAGNAVAGSVISRLAAVDTDKQAANKKVTYQIVSQRDAAGTQVDVFALASANGILTIAASGADLKKSSAYTLVVRATDGGSQPLSVDWTITINVRDLIGKS